MSRLVLVCAVMAAMACAVSADTRCDNPLFNMELLPSKYSPDGNLQLLPAPRTANGLRECTMWNGKKACCSESTFNSIMEGIDAEDEQIIEAEKKLKEMESAAGSLPPIYRRLVSISKRIYIPALNCMSAWLGYVSGMFCLACEPDWQTVYNNETSVLLLSTGSCAGIADHCVPAVDIIGRNIMDFLDALADMMAQSGDPDGASQVREAIADMKRMDIDWNNLCGWVQRKTGKSCHDIVCDAISPFSMDLEGMVPNDTVHTTVRHLSGLVAHLLSDAPNRDQKIAAAALSLTSHFRGLAKAATQDNSGAAPGASTHVKTEFSPKGYKAYETGCSSGMSTVSCKYKSTGSSDGNNAGLIAGIVVTFLLITAFAVGSYVWYKRKNQTASTGYLPVNDAAYRPQQGYQPAPQGYAPQGQGYPTQGYPNQGQGYSTGYAPPRQ